MGSKFFVFIVGVRIGQKCDDIIYILMTWVQAAVLSVSVGSFTHSLCYFPGDRGTCQLFVPDLTNAKVNMRVFVMNGTGIHTCHQNTHTYQYAYRFKQTCVLKLQM